MKKNLLSIRGLMKFSCGGLAYNMLEILWRGYSHISMFLLGGLCFMALIHISKSQLGLAAQCLTGGLFITVSELLTGFVVNVWLKLNVWDSSAEAFNLFGQVCPRFFLLWCAISAAVVLTCRTLGTHAVWYSYTLIKSKKNTG